MSAEDGTPTCPLCGALMGDVEAHRRWHVASLTGTPSTLKEEILRGLVEAERMVGL